jgi:hypothetical protein
VVTIGENGAITVNPDGDGFTFPTSDGTSNQVLKTDGNGNVSWTDMTGGSSTATLNDVVSNGNTTYYEVTVGGLNIANNFTLPTSDGDAGNVLKTDGNGNVSWGSTAAGAGTFPFFKSDGSSDGIAVSGGTFPFYNSDGNLDTIAVA